jgi:hypothetical protein
MQSKPGQGVQAIEPDLNLTQLLGVHENAQPPKAAMAMAASTKTS